MPHCSETTRAACTRSPSPLTLRHTSRGTSTVHILTNTLFTCSGFRCIPGCSTRCPSRGSGPLGSEPLETETPPRSSDTRIVSVWTGRERTHIQYFRPETYASMQTWMLGQCKCKALIYILNIRNWTFKQILKM